MKPIWVAREDVRAIFSALDGAPTMVVGGAVRDELLGIADESTEIDIATTLTPDEVEACLVRAKIKYLTIGKAHGTITALIKNRTIEITTLRRDIKTDGRHAEVVFTKDWHEDAMRRDLTINALYCEQDGTLHDFTGAGLDDIKEKRVRFIGDAVMRLEEDYLRVLRFFRFHYALTANTSPDSQAFEACKQVATQLQNLSGERRRNEFFKILALPAAIAAVRMFHEIDVLQYLAHYEEAHIEKLARLINNYPESDILLRLAALLPDTQSAKNTAALLRLTNVESTRLIAIASPIDLTNIKAALYWHGAQIISDQAMLTNNTSALDAARAWQKPIFPLTGTQIKARGIKEGKALGVLLKELESWWIEQDFPPTSALDAELKRKLGE